VDGDTLVSGGERVRLIGVDTPELHHPNKPAGCFARAAADFTTRELAGRAVRLERDVSDRDAYRRVLAYVWTGPPADSDQAARAHLFNARLLSEGYAQVLTIPPDVRHAALFVRLEGEARAAGRGLWGACTP
jgi:micrococcal nuclease